MKKQIALLACLSSWSLVSAQDEVATEQDPEVQAVEEAELAESDPPEPEELETPRLEPVVAAESVPEPEPDESDLSLQDQIFELEERLDSVERATVLDRIHLGGDFRFIYNAVWYEGPTPNPYDRVDPMAPVTRTIRQTNPEIWSMRFRIQFRAEPVDSVRVTARLSMYKIFGDADSPAFIQDSMSTRLPRDAGVRFDTAWLDWFATDWLSFSGGRIAYSGGNPAELRNNSDVRQGTWGLHMVDGEYDTVNMTFNMSRLVDEWYLRFFYASWFNDNDDDVFGGFPFLNSGTQPLRIVGGNLDLKIPGLGRNFVQLGYYIVPKFRPFTIPIPDPAFDPSADYTRAPAPLNGSLLFPSQMPSSLGTYQNASALLQFYDIGGIGLDLFAAGAIGFLDPNDEAIGFELPNPMTGERATTPFLVLTSAGDDGKTYFAYAGFRYTLPWEALNETKLGFEWNYGSRYMLSFAVQTDQLLTKLATRGMAYEAYLIVPVNEHLYFRASYMFIDGRYQGGFFGPNPALGFPSTSLRVDTRVHSLNLVLNASL